MAPRDTSRSFYTHTERQFWRESEQRWVPNVNIITWGSHKDDPKKWRHRVITTTIEAGEWEVGRGR